MNFQQKFAGRLSRISKEGTFDLVQPIAKAPAKHVRPTVAAVTKTVTPLSPKSAIQVSAGTILKGPGLVCSDAHSRNSVRVPTKRPPAIARVKSMLAEELPQNLVGSNRYTPYTMRDYHALDLNVHLGGLGPATLGTAQWAKEKGTLDKCNEYAKTVNIRNASLLQRRLKRLM